MNELLFYSLIRHQTYLMRYSAGLSNSIIDLLERTEEDVLAKIAYRIKEEGGYDKGRLEALVAQIKAIRGKAWEASQAAWVSELTDLSKEHSGFLADTLIKHNHFIIAPILPPTDYLKQIIISNPFEGKVLLDWASDLQSTDLKRISNDISIGMSQGESGAVVARRVKDSLGISRRNAQAITRTAVNHIANQTSREFYKKNKDIVEFEIYVATLDGRTTAICKSKDGNKYEVGAGPTPPLHFGCRSLRVPSVDGKLYGSRPMKPTTEKQLVREFKKNHNLTHKGGLRKHLPRGSKGKFDKFARKRTNEMTGQVPADQNYTQFLKKQPRWFVDDTLGKTRSKLFREGGLSLDRFVDKSGKELTISQLRARNRNSFKRLGL